MTKKALTNKQSLSRQVWHFIIHLRWHYQVFILSGGYLMGGYLGSVMEWPSFLLQFANVHLLLFGGATAYNSCWDNDRGPVGGLTHPPPMQPWMRPASLLLQFMGLLIALKASVAFVVVYVISMIFFWLYSTPHLRWKGRPVGSLVAIGISTGSNSLLLGYFAAGNITVDGSIWAAAPGVALIILSLYPVSQLFQLDEDYRRDDVTFAIAFGFAGVIRFFQVTYAGGVLLAGMAIASGAWLPGIVFVAIGAAAGWWIYRRLVTLTVEAEDYPRVMRIKYVTSLAFVSFIVLLLVFKNFS